MSSSSVGMKAAMDSLRATDWDAIELAALLLEAMGSGLATVAVQKSASFLRRVRTSEPSRTRSIKLLGHVLINGQPNVRFRGQAEVICSLRELPVPKQVILWWREGDLPPGSQIGLEENGRGQETSLANPRQKTFRPASYR